MLEFKENEKIKNRYLTAILNNTDCGMIYTDSEGKISHYNSMGNRLFSNKVYIDDNIFDLVQEVDREFILELRNEVKNILIDTKKEKVSMDITPVQQSENKNSFLFIFRRFKNIEESANILRKSLVNVEFSAKHTWKDLVTCNKNFEEVKKIAKHYAETENTILITGESGTGKELFAQSIHNESRRRGESFVAFNCANISENLIESELFGYEEGAFTGARRRGKKGLFELAHKGTIFLDEISEIPYHLQNKFLRVLQEKELEKVGSNKTINLDIRVICCTNQDLKEMVKGNRFREDLYYRINIIEIHIPPLREHKKDIPLLCEHFIKKINKCHGCSIEDISEKMMENFQKYHWPGNIRELEHVLERACVTTTSGILQEEHFDFFLPRIFIEQSIDEEENRKDTLTYQKNQTEYKAILKALETSGKNKTRAAKILNITRSQLYEKLKKYNLM